MEDSLKEEKEKAERAKRIAQRKQEDELARQ